MLIRGPRHARPRGLDHPVADPQGDEGLRLTSRLDQSRDDDQRAALDRLSGLPDED